MLNYNGKKRKSISYIQYEHTKKMQKEG